MENKETLEEVYLNKIIDEANKEFTLDKKLAKEVAIKFSKWQQERSYSEKELLEILGYYADWSINGDCTYYEWFEQFKKK